MAVVVAGQRSKVVVHLPEQYPSRGWMILVMRYRIGWLWNEGLGGTSLPTVPHQRFGNQLVAHLDRSIQR